MEIKSWKANRLSKISKCTKKKKEKGLYGMIHILSFIDNHKSSPKENLCICRSSAVAPAAIFFAPGVVSAVETKFNWICNAVNFFHVRRVRGPFFLLFLFCFKEKGEKFCSPSRSSVFCMCCLRWNAFICREISDKSGCWKMTFYICVHLLFRCTSKKVSFFFRLFPTIRISFLVEWVSFRCLWAWWWFVWLALLCELIPKAP